MFNLMFLLINTFDSMNKFTYSKPCLSTIKQNEKYLRLKTSNKKIIKLEKDLKSCTHKIITNNILICRKITWKDYLFVDDKSFDDDVEEMYKKYKCTNEISNINNLADLENLFNLELSNRSLYIFDVCDLFDTKNICKTLELNHKNIILNNDLTNLKKFNKYETLYELTDIKKKVSKLSGEHQKFYMLLNTIIDDSVFVFENASTYFFYSNKNVEETLVRIKTSQSLSLKIKTFINFLYDIINLDIQNKKMKYNITLEFLLQTKHPKKQYFSQILNFISNKFRTFKKNLKKEKISQNDLLQYTIFYINNINDELIQQMCVLGLQSLFIMDYNYTIPKFSKILIFLYTFKNERHIFQVNWYKQLFKLLTVSNPKNLTDKKISVLFDDIVKDNAFLKYNLYFALNSSYLGIDLQNYIDIQKNKNEVELLNFFIDLITKVKCKLFSINLENNIGI